MIMSIYTNLMLLVWITLQMLINIPSMQNSKNISNEAQKFWYKTWFPWKSNHPNLYTNRNGSLACLSNLFSKVQHDPAFFKIEEQLVGGVFKNAPATMRWKEFYISYRPVVKKSAKTTKLQSVYIASAKPTKTADLQTNAWKFEVGPSLQNSFWNVQTRCWLKPFFITRDLNML